MEKQEYKIKYNLLLKSIKKEYIRERRRLEKYKLEPIGVLFHLSSFSEYKKWRIKNLELFDYSDKQRNII